MRHDKGSDFVSSMSGLINLSLTLQGLNKSLEAQSGLSIVQWSVLNALIQAPVVSPQLLAKTLKVTPGTLTQSLTRLSKKDFLFMRSDPRDARKKMISITRKGKDALESAEQEYRRIFSGINLIRAGIDTVDGFLKNMAKTRILRSSS